MRTIVILVAVAAFAGPAAAQVRVRAGYNPYTGRAGATTVARNPWTGTVQAQTRTVNPWTGTRTGTTAGYNPYTGGAYRTGAAANPWTGRVGGYGYYRR